nr:reverse transcriptase domain-containing protein [Tanacetum cinerariifolium]
LLLPELTSTCMTLELADRSVSKPIGIAKYVSVKVGVFHFPVDFVVVDFEPDPRVPLILESDFLLEEVDAFLAIDDDPTSPEVDHTYLNLEGYILLLKSFLNDDPSPPPNQGNYLPDVHKDKKNQSSAPASSPALAPVKAVNQPPAYQAPIPQTQSVSTTDFESYVKANDAVLRNMQNQGQNLQIQMANLTDMLSKFMSSNTASSSGSGTLPSNTITNPKEDLKGITTRSGVAYQGPIIPTLSKVMKQGTEVTKDQVQTPSSQSTTPVQPPVVQSKTQTLVSEPVVAPVSAPMPNLKPSIPYPSRRDNERHHDQANEQNEKFYEIFKDMSFEISFTDALILMPKFASTLKALIGNKEKLSEMARTSMNEHCSAVILNKLPRKLRDPDKFLIPCEFPGMDDCLALADLGTSINLKPLFVWEGLSLSELTPTCMTLELAERSVSKPIGIVEDVSFKVEYSQEVLGFSDITTSGSPTHFDDPIVSTTSLMLTPFGDSDFLLFEEADAFLGLEDDPDSPELDPSYYDPEGTFSHLKLF